MRVLTFEEFSAQEQELISKYNSLVDKANWAAETKRFTVHRQCEREIMRLDKRLEKLHDSVKDGFLLPLV